MELCGQRNSAGAFDVNGAIGLWACLGENADEVEDSVRSGDCSVDSAIVKDIGLDNLRSVGRFSWHLNAHGMTHGHAHRCATPKKHRHKMAADEAGSAEHRDAADRHLPPW